MVKGINGHTHTLYLFREASTYQPHWGDSLLIFYRSPVGIVWGGGGES